MTDAKQIYVICYFLVILVVSLCSWWMAKMGIFNNSPIIEYSPHAFLEREVEKCYYSVTLNKFWFKYYIFTLNKFMTLY